MLPEAQRSRVFVAGKEYALGQHGFARDMEFSLLSQTSDTVWFVLESNSETLSKYPFPFRLEIGYHLQGNQVDVMWKVTNPSDEVEMFFQIGAHPAFYWKDAARLGYFRLETSDAVPVQADGSSRLVKSVITEKGCVDPNQKQEVVLDAACLLPLSWEVFAKDALIFENSQVRKVSLLDADKQPYLSLSFDAPLVGLWSPPGKHAPFVCIEPWYGRCDRVHYAGDFTEKDWVQHLAPKATFSTQYTIGVE